MTALRAIPLAQAALWLLILLYIVHFSTLSIAQHDSFQTHKHDLGNMDQPIWNTLQGRFLEQTRLEGHQATRLTDHFEPFFLLVSLVFLLWDDVRALLVLQTVFIALGALPAFCLARDRFRQAGPAGPWIGVVFASIYLLFPSLQAANMTEFHAVPLAVPLLLAAFYFGTKSRVLPFLAFGFLAMTVKEDVSLLTFMLGLYFFLRRRPRWAGALLAGVSLAWFAVSTFVIIPHFGREQYQGLEQSIYFHRYGEFGEGPKDILLTMLREPWKVFSVLLSAERLNYVIGLLASGGFLALLAPATTLICLPLYLANTLSNFPPMYAGMMHYSAPLVPFFLAGAIGGAGWLADRLADRRWLSRPVAGGIIAGWALLWSLGYQALEGYSALSLRYEPGAVTEHHRLLPRFADQIPARAPMSTTPPLYPHLSHRERLHQFPVILDSGYILLDVSSTTDMHPNDFRRAFLDLWDGASEHRFGLIDAADGYLLLQRDAAGMDALPAEFYDFVRTDEAVPDHRYQIDFGPGLRFLGFSIMDNRRWELTSIRTYWEILGPQPEDLRLYPFFIDREGNVIDSTEERPMVGPLWYPPALWQEGEILHFDTLRWALGEEWTFCLGVMRGDNWRQADQRVRVESEGGKEPAYLMEGNTWARLLTFERGGRLSGFRLKPVRLDDDTPAQQLLPSRQLLSETGDIIELLGYSLEKSVAEPGDIVPLTLYWRVSNPPALDYTVFVHLLSDDGTSLPQRDAMPNWRGPLPTTSWPAGQVIPDTQHIVIPSDASEGAYKLNVGMYYWETMSRLQVIGPAEGDASDVISLTALRVAR